MASAELEQTTADIEVKGRDGKTYTLRATGSIVQFEGFLKLYEEGRDERVHAAKGKDDHAEDDDDSRRLPPLAEGDKVTDRAIEAEQHFTQPPPRFSEATLVKKMEELGIGRPSTYASTLAVLQERDYVRIDKKRLIPEDKGRLVIAFLESFFKRYVEFDFTADLEEKLDLISDSKLEWKDVLRDFWRDFTGAIDEIKDLRVGEVLEALNEMLGPHIFPRARTMARDPRTVPQVRDRPPEPEDLAASTAPSSAAATIPSAATRASSAAGEATAKPRARRQAARLRSRDRPAGRRCARAASARTCSSAKARRREAQALVAPERHRRRHHRSRKGAAAAVAAARGRRASRRPASRSPPASAAMGPSSCTTAPTPTATASRTCSPSASTAPSTLLAEKKAGRRQGRFGSALREDGAEGARRASRRRRQDPGARRHATGPT